MMAAILFHFFNRGYETDGLDDFQILRKKVPSCQPRRGIGIADTSSFANLMADIWHGDTMRPCVSNPSLMEHHFIETEKQPLVLMVFVIGGISPHEIRYVQEFQDKLQAGNTDTKKVYAFVGSNNLITPQSFAKELFNESL